MLPNLEGDRGAAALDGRRRCGEEKGEKENAAEEGKAAVLQREGVAGEGREAAAEGK